MIQLAGLRGKLMGEILIEGSMASLVCDPDEARGLLQRIDGYAVIANINSASQTVVSGDRAAIAATIELASKSWYPARTSRVGRLPLGPFRRYRERASRDAGPARHR